MAKYKDIKDFFKKNLPHIEPTERLYRELRTFRLNWSTKADDYIDFLGSKLLGVHTIRFSTLDDNALMVDTLKIPNWKELQKEIYEVPGIEKNFKVASDIIYQTLTYIAHLFFKHKDKKLREDGVREACLIMQYRMMSYFKFNTTEAIATTVYNKLSHKYLIKQHRNWQEVFEYRVKNCLDKKSPNYKKLDRFNTEDAIRIISDIQTKLREQVKQIYKILIDILEKNDIIQQESSTFVGGEKEEEQIKSVTSTNIDYITVIKNSIFNKNDFVIDDLIKVVDSLVPNSTFDLLKQTLNCISDTDDEKEKQKILIYAEEVIVISLDYLQRINLNIRDRKYIPKALVLIKNYWSSSKVKNPTMEEIKKYFREKSFKCTGKKTSWLLVSLSIALVVYIFLRSLKQGE